MSPGIPRDLSSGTPCENCSIMNAFKNFSFNWRIILLYNVVVVSAVPQHESVILSIYLSIYTSSSCASARIPIPPPSRSPQSAEPAHCARQQVPTSYLFCTWQGIYANATSSQLSPPSSFPGCVHKPFEHWVPSTPLSPSSQLMFP